jgi:fatty acid desaturase
MTSRNDRKGDPVEPKDKQPMTRAARVWVAVGMLAVVAGIAGWTWTSEWRWSATGLLAMLLAWAVASVCVDGKRQ